MSDFHTKWRQFLAEEEPFQREMRDDLPDELNFLLNTGSNDKREGPGVRGMTKPSGKSAPPMGEGVRLLREISEAEVEHIRRAINEMGPEDLAFNDLFRGKTRLVTRFPVKDSESELGKFVNELERTFKLNIDWNKGIASAKREWDEHSEENFEQLVQRTMGRHAPAKVIKKAFQMKIGKYFAKVDQLATQYKKILQKLGDHKHGPGTIEPTDRDRWLLRYEMRDILEALTEQEMQRYRQVLNQLELYLGTSSQRALGRYMMNPLDQSEWTANEQSRRDYQDKQDRNHGQEPRDRKPIVPPETRFADMGTYWLKKAKWIKENIGTLENDKYSIIITRDPIDILRMSDFENITSCHTPPSRGGGDTHYKCAVAEAHGHGAVAYVVETKDLLSATNTGNIDSAEQEIQEGELFPDDKRSGAGGYDINPVSRVRLRKFTYDFDQRAGLDTEHGPHWSTAQLAVPEKRVYGKKIPGFVDRVASWARENQEEVLSKMPRDENGLIELDNFAIVGGSYEDTAMPAGRKILMSQLTGLPEDQFVGNVGQDTEEEDDLDPTMFTAGQMAELQREVDVIVDKWNNLYQAAEIEADIQDEDGQIIIFLKAWMTVTWNLDDWDKLPLPNTAHWPVGELNDFGWLWADKDSSWIHRRHLGPGGQRSQSDNIQLGFKIDPTKITPPDTLPRWAIDADEVESFGAAINKIDDMYDGIKHIITRHYKNEGHMHGGEFLKLAHEVVNGEWPWPTNAWTVKTDNPHDPDEVYEITATVEYVFDPDEVEMNPKVLQMVLEDREFRQAVRKSMLDPLRKQTGIEYYIDIDEHSTGSSVGPGGIKYEFVLVTHDELPNEIASLFKTVIEEIGDEEIETILMNTLQTMKRLRMPSGMRQEEPEGSSELTEVRHRQTARMYNKWRKFLCS